MTAHFSILVWEIQRTKEPGRLQSMESQSQTWLSDWRTMKRKVCFEKLCLLVTQYFKLVVIIALFLWSDLKWVIRKFDDSLLVWSIVALHCVSFCCRAASAICIYIYIPSFLDFLPIEVTTEHGVEFSVLYSRFSLDIYFIQSISSVYMSVPISQFIPSHPELKWL